MSSERFINCRHPGCEEPLHRGSYCREHADRFYVKPTGAMPKEKRKAVVLRKNGGFKVVPKRD